MKKLYNYQTKRKLCRKIRNQLFPETIFTLQQCFPGKDFAEIPNNKQDTRKSELVTSGLTYQYQPQIDSKTLV